MTTVALSWAAQHFLTTRKETHFGNHHNGLKRLKRDGHLVSNKVFMDTASTSSLPSFLLTCKVAGLSAKWTTGELPVDNSLVSERTAPMVARLDSEGANQSTCRCVSLILASQCTDELDEVRKDSRNTHTHALMS